MVNKSIKIVLPGGAGLVGQNLVVHLKQLGYFNLVVLDKHEKNLATLRKLHPDVTTELADLAEPGPWMDHFRDAGVAVMLQAQIGGEQEDPFIRNNLTSTQHILHALKQHAVPHIVHISSSVVNSVAKDFYTDTKRRQEESVLQSGIPCVVLRPTLMFGWFDRKHLGWLSRFMKKIPVFPIPGSGRVVRQPLYVRDFCAIIVDCIEKRTSGQAFNISGSERINYVDIIREIRRSTHAKCVIVHIPISVFRFLLATWAVFDKDPPFTVNQLDALLAADEFEIIDWPHIFNTTATPFSRAVEETFAHPTYSKVVLDF